MEFVLLKITSEKEDVDENLSDISSMQLACSIHKGRKYLSLPIKRVWGINCAKCKRVIPQLSLSVNLKSNYTRSDSLLRNSSTRE